MKKSRVNGIVTKHHAEKALQEPSDYEAERESIIDNINRLRRVSENFNEHWSYRMGNRGISEGSWVALTAMEKTASDSTVKSLRHSKNVLNEISRSVRSDHHEYVIALLQGISFGIDTTLDRLLKQNIPKLGDDMEKVVDIPVAAPNFRQEAASNLDKAIADYGDFVTESMKKITYAIMYPENKDETERVLSHLDFEYQRLKTQLTGLFENNS